MEGQRPCSDTIVPCQYGNISHFNVQLLFLNEPTAFFSTFLLPLLAIAVTDHQEKPADFSVRSMVQTLPQFECRLVGLSIKEKRGYRLSTRYYIGVSN
nr:MAG TPA: CPFTSY TRANSPORT, CHLOROPLAST BIOGENESIS, SIMIBI.8A [Caudoviricetes sp.]